MIYEKINMSKYMEKQGFRPRKGISLCFGTEPPSQPGHLAISGVHTTGLPQQQGAVLCRQTCGGVHTYIPTHVGTVPFHWASELGTASHLMALAPWSV